MPYQRNRLIHHLQDPTAHNGRTLANPPSEIMRWLSIELEAEHRSYHREPGCHLIDPQLHSYDLQTGRTRPVWASTAVRPWSPRGLRRPEPQNPRPSGRGVVNSTDREWSTNDAGPDYGNDEVEADPDEDNLQESIDNGYYDDPEPAA